MDAISQTTFSSAFSWIKMFEFWLKFHWSLFLSVQLRQPRFCGRSRRSPDLEVSIALGRRAEILIAVTAGGFCLTRICSRSRHTICRGAASQHKPTLFREGLHPHLNSMFASKLHAQDPLHWVICIRLIRWHGAHLQAVVIVMKILLPDPEKLPSSLSCLWSRNLWVLPELIMSGRVIAYAGDLNFYHDILCFLCRGLQFYLKTQNKTKQKRELNRN